MAFILTISHSQKDKYWKTDSKEKINIIRD